MNGQKIATIWALGLALLAGVGCQSTAPLRGDYAAFLRTPGTTSAAVDYRIAPPDRLSITGSAWPDAGLERVKVRPDGTVALPVLGDVLVAGLTAEEATDALTLRLRATDPEAKVCVKVSAYASQHVYVFGQVADTGPFAWEAGTRLLDVIAQARPVDGAATKRIEVVRPDDDGTLSQRVTVDVEQVIRSGDATLNLVLRPGDVVYVPKWGSRKLEWNTLPAPRVVERVVEKVVERVVLVEPEGSSADNAAEVEAGDAAAEVSGVAASGTEPGDAVVADVVVDEAMGEAAAVASWPAVDAAELAEVPPPVWGVLVGDGVARESEAERPVMDARFAQVEPASAGAEGFSVVVQEEAAVAVAPGMRVSPDNPEGVGEGMQAAASREGSDVLEGCFGIATAEVPLMDDGGVVFWE